MALFILPKQTALDTVGETIAGAKLYFYITATSTPLNVYSDIALTTPLSNPVIADGSGRFPVIYMASASYKIVFTDENDVTIYTIDPVQGGGDGVWAADSYIKRNGTNTGWTNLTSVQVFDDIKQQATTTYMGAAELATDAEAIAGTSTTVVLTPANVTAVFNNKSVLPRGYIDGLVLTLDADANHDISFGEGVARDAADTQAITNSSATIKQTDADWAVGSNVGGMPAKVTKTGTFTTVGTAVTGVLTLFNTEFAVGDILWATSKVEGRRITGIADPLNMTIESAFSTDVAVAIAPQVNGLAPNTWYHTYAISSTSGIAEFGYDSRMQAVRLLGDATVSAASITKYRRIGSVLTNSSNNIIAFLQIGDYFYWKIPFLDLDEANNGTAVNKVLSTPIGVSVMALLAANVSEDRSIYIYHPGLTDTTVGQANAYSVLVFSASADETAGVQVQVLTNTISQIRIDSSSGGGGNRRITTLGWNDFRGKDA